MLNFEHLPVSGPVVAGALLWGAVSALFLGPMVADRTIRADWSAQCVHELQVAQSFPQRPLPPVFGLTCDALGGVLDALTVPGASAELCGSGFGKAFDESVELGKEINPLEMTREAAQAEAERRIARAAELAPDRCSCAKDVVIEENRLGWGLHAGSLRLASKPSDLDAKLTRALHSPACAFKMEDLG